VTREQRDALSALAARYLRGELTPAEFEEACQQLSTQDTTKTVGRVVADLFTRVHLATDSDLMGRQIPLDQRYWERYRKSLAYLRSNLPDRKLGDLPFPPHEPWNASDSRLLLLVTGPGTAALLFSMQFGVWPYLATCAGLAGAFALAWYRIVVTFQQSRAQPNEAKQAWQQKRELWPFTDEAEWKQYAPLVDELHLPSWEEYEPFTKRADFQLPQEPPQSVAWWVVQIVLYLLLALLVIGCMPVILALTGLAALDFLLRDGKSAPR